MKQHNTTPAIHLPLEAKLDLIRERLPILARGIVEKYLLDPSKELYSLANESFAQNPDDPAQHTPEWHQHGILTHSEEFREALTDELPQLVDELGVSEPVNTALGATIDGTTKGDLLQMAALLHDVGKFAARKFEERDGSTVARFIDHEVRSGEIIQDEPLHGMLRNKLALTEDQIAYIARCAQLHFELGKVRRAITDIDKKGYTMAFARSEQAKTVMKDVILKHPDFALEIGLMFAADSYSKTDISATGETDRDIAEQEEQLKQDIAAKGLHPKLIGQAMQMPVNVEITKQYLRLWADQQVVS